MSSDDRTQPIFVQREGPPKARWLPTAMTRFNQDNRYSHWMVTFKEEYRGTVHPTALPRARRCHPDGFVLIKSSDQAGLFEVEKVTRKLFSGGLDDIVRYQPQPGITRAWPLGCLGTFDAITNAWLGEM